LRVKEVLTRSADVLVQQREQPISES
jgi:hypothetical protein